MHFTRASLARTTISLLGMALLTTSAALAEGHSNKEVESAKSAYGEVTGATLGSDGSPVGSVTIIIRQNQSGATQKILSNSDGSYEVANLAPGQYTITATLDGDPQTGTVASGQLVDVMADTTVREDLSVQTATTAAAPQPTTPPAKRGFMTRWGHAYLDDWTVDSSGAPAAPAPERRGTPAPLNSPPFPSADWPIGGAPVIGAPDYQTYPLMQAINENKSRIKVYGWVDIGANGSTSNKGKYANNEEAYDVIPNSIQLDQVALYIERLENTVQTDHIDWGFRFTNLYGLDYRYTTAKGVFSQQLLSGPSGQTYGYDPVMYYFDLYLPKIGQGTVVRVGRYISLPDIEAQLAPNNYTYSHSILYTYDCYTQNGINATTKLSSHWTAQAGVSGGCETAPWISNAKLTGDACLSYSWTNGTNNLYACANAVNSAKYAYNNLNAYYLTYYHKINATWHTDTEAYYQYEKDVPNLCYLVSPCISYGSNANIGENSGLITSPGLITGANGAQCDPSQTHCFAPSAAIVNYLEHEFNNHHSSLNIRNEFVEDFAGQRTGNKTSYYEGLVGFNFWLGSTVTFRPELRYEHSFNVPAYDSPFINGANGPPTKSSQLTAAADLIWHF
jgi:Putative beta-barrel porin-2, OmpL-like. bbp2/Carboxypeptidase regulatory-like domain